MTWRDYAAHLRRAEIRPTRKMFARWLTLPVLMRAAIAVAALLASILPGVVVFSVLRVTYAIEAGSSVTPTQVTNYLLSQVATLAAFAVSMWLFTMLVQLLALTLQFDEDVTAKKLWLTNVKRSLTRAITALGIGLPYTMLAYYLAAKFLTDSWVGGASTSDSTVLADLSLMMAYLFFSVWILVEAAVAVWWLFRPGRVTGALIGLIVVFSVACAVDYFQLFDKFTILQASGSNTDVVAFMSDTGLQAGAQWLTYGFLALLPLGFVVTVGYRYWQFRHELDG